MEPPRPIETERLRIRRFEPGDVAEAERIHEAVGWIDPERTRAERLARRETWLRWNRDRFVEQARLSQPPHGDRAVVLRESGALVGCVGLVPCLDRFGVLPAFGGDPESLARCEMGLFWMIDPVHQRRGFATEAAAALIIEAFEIWRLERILATTESENVASQAVMRRLGMQLERNPGSEPPWLQVVGWLDHPDATRPASPGG